MIMKLFRRIIRPLFQYLVKPVVERYLSRPRLFRQGDLKLTIAPGVFHPGFFFSTQFLLDYLKRIDVQGLRLLELGAGSGLIALSMAGAGAQVLASDINPTAVEHLRRNARENQIPLTVIESDLFRDIPPQVFDLVAVNPPYYPRTPRSAAEYAWYCGAELEYFRRLFPEMHPYLRPSSRVIMVLSEDCRIEEIRSLAEKNGYRVEQRLARRIWGEWNFIFEMGLRDTVIE